MNDTIAYELRKSAETISNIDPEQISAIADAMTEALRSGNQVIFMGNGGSSADAQHLAAELSGRYLFDRPAMAGVCLSNIAPVTAVGNDYSYDIVFSRQVEAIARPGDVIVGLSTSGNSKNVILAMEKGKEIGCVTVSFTGMKGRMREIADFALTVPSEDTPHIQEGYLAAGHMVCCLVERMMYGRRAVFVDRDDTIAEDVPYCDSPDKFRLFDGVPEAIKRLNDAGYLVIVVTNQSGIARGKFSEEVLNSIHRKMVDEVTAKGGRIDDIFVCPHHPDDKCGCRKPETGMGIAAVRKHHIDVKRSYMIGNGDCDMEFGKRLGCRCIRVGDGTTFADAVDSILSE